MIGITPMIGQNDDSAEVFKPADATTITQFAEATGWIAVLLALQRDQTGTANDLDRFSR